MKKSLLALAAFAATAAALPITPAFADQTWTDQRDQRNDGPGGRHDDGRRGDNHRGDDRRDGRGDDRRGDDRRGYGNGRGYGNRQAMYDSRGRYAQPRRIDRNSRVWRGNDGRYYCRRDNGTAGLIIGAGVGALAGNQIAGRGDRTLGAILGGVAGGALGREIDRGGMQCR
jgi:Ni/Co efflux regulator RcnB